MTVDGFDASLYGTAGKFLSSCVYPGLSANAITRFVLSARMRYAPALQGCKRYSPQVPRATEMIVQVRQQDTIYPP